MTGGVDRARLLRWVDDRAHVALGGPLTGERLANEKDALALLLGARAAERAGERDRARHLFEAARQADPKDAQGVASEGSFALLREQAQDDAARGHAALLLGFAKMYPASPWAVRAIAEIAALPTDARPRVADLRRAVQAVHEATDVPNAWLAQHEHELGLSQVTPTPPPGTTFPPPVDPLVDALPVSDAIEGLPPEARAMIRRDQAIGARVGKACKDAPRAREIRQEWVRVWIHDGAEAEPALKVCVEKQVSQELDLPSILSGVRDVPIHSAAPTGAARGHREGTSPSQTPKSCTSTLPEVDHYDSFITSNTENYFACDAFGQSQLAETWTWFRIECDRRLRPTDSPGLPGGPPRVIERALSVPLLPRPAHAQTSGCSWRTKLRN